MEIRREGKIHRLRFNSFIGPWMVNLACLASWTPYAHHLTKPITLISIGLTSASLFFTYFLGTKPPPNLRKSVGILSALAVIAVEVAYFSRLSGSPILFILIASLCAFGVLVFAKEGLIFLQDGTPIPIDNSEEEIPSGAAP